MLTMAGSSMRLTRMLLAALLAGAACLVLSACAGGPGSTGSGAASADLVTDSDESDGRRRARIRLELAVGYFEQGQTTIALDELKQALVADPSFAEAHNFKNLILNTTK